MSTRTPNLQERSKFHHYWGIYDDVDDLPNESSNLLPNPEFSKLEAGDVAFTTAEEILFVCIDPGTPNGGNAIWRAASGGGAGERFYKEDNSNFITASGAEQIALSLTINPTLGGTYLASWYGEVEASPTANTRTRFRIDGNIEGDVLVPSVMPSNFDQNINGFVEAQFVASVPATLEITIQRVGGPGAIKIRRRRIDVERKGP